MTVKTESAGPETIEITPENIAREYGPAVSSLCRRMITDREKCRDAAQEVWIEILKSLPGFRGESRLSTWIYTICRRTLNRFIANEKKYTTRFLSELFSIRSDDGLTEMDRIPSEDRKIWMKLQCQDCMTGIMHCLDNPTRFIYLLRVLTPLSYEEIAEICEKDPASVRQTFSRASRKVNHFLNDQCLLYNPRGSCRCKMKKPIETLDREKSYLELRDFSRKLYFLQTADTYQEVRDYWKNIEFDK